MNDAIQTFVRIEAIFNEALDTPAETRDSLVTERCGGDTKLQAEVRALLRACEA